MSEEKTFDVTMSQSQFSSWLAETLISEHWNTRQMNAIVNLCDLPEGEIPYPDLAEFFRNVINAIVEKGFLSFGAQSADSATLLRWMCSFLVDNPCPVAFQSTSAEIETTLSEPVDAPAKIVSLEELVNGLKATRYSGTIREAFDIINAPEGVIDKTEPSLVALRQYLENLTEETLDTNPEKTISGIINLATNVVETFDALTGTDYTLPAALEERIRATELLLLPQAEDGLEALQKIESVSASHPLANEIAELILSPRPACLMTEEEIVDFLDVCIRATSNGTAPPPPVVSGDNADAMSKKIEEIVFSLYRTQNKTKEQAISRINQMAKTTLSGTWLAKKIDDTVSPRLNRRNIKVFSGFIERTLKDLLLSEERIPRLAVNPRASLDLADERKRLMVISAYSHQTIMLFIEDVIRHAAKQGALVGR